MKKTMKATFKNPIKRRDFMALELYTNGLFKHKIIKSKKIYNRKKLKKVRDYD